MVCGDPMGGGRPMRCGDVFGCGDPMGGDDVIGCNHPTGGNDSMGCADLAALATSSNRRSASQSLFTVVMMSETCCILFVL